MKTYRKQDYPLHQIRRHLETGPIVLVSSAWKGKANIMTMGWHMVLEFTPALFACCISAGNYTFEMVRKSKECVINVPTVELAEAVVGIGNSTGATLDKFEHFGLTAGAAAKVGAPLIEECYASFECQLAEGSLISRYNLFIWEVVKAHVAPSPKNPRTLHYRGEGEFMIAGRTISMRDKFRSEML
jgi:flavin reductase (DIM6/NTAB) family NADH-FMN oxidoreductase RutF